VLALIEYWPCQLCSQAIIYHDRWKEPGMLALMIVPVQAVLVAITTARVILVLYRKYPDEPLCSSGLGETRRDILKLEDGRIANQPLISDSSSLQAIGTSGLTSTV
jgi:hypothetical protein